MGKQVNFFLTTEDQISLLEKLAVKTKFLMISEKSPTKNPVILNHLDKNKILTEYYTIFLILPMDLSKVVTKYFEPMSHWKIDSYRSPVIEYSICGNNLNNINRGRFYLENRNQNFNASINSEKFTIWSNSVLKMTRRTLSYEKSMNQYYYGVEAKKWIKESGAQLVPGGFRWTKENREMDS